MEKVPRSEAPVMGPAPALDSPEGLSAARASVLYRLRLLGRACGVAELADHLGLHPNTIREHLDGLVDAGLADRERGPVEGRGRPPWTYRARSRVMASPRAREYAGLAGALAAQIARSSADPRADALAAGEAWGRDLVAGAPACARPATARREVVRLLDGLGFDPQADDRARSARLRRCPLLEVARAHPGVVCTVHLGIVRGALDALGGAADRTDLLPFAEPGACRLHLLTPPP